MAVFGFVKFQFCLKSVNISFEPEFGNPRFETPKKLNVFIFQLTCFSAIVVDFITSVEKPGVFNLFLSHFFFMLSSKRGVLNPAFQTQLFKTQVLTQPDFENPPKIHFKSEKGHFWITLKRPLFHYCSITF